MPATPPPDTGPPTRVVSTAAASNATATPSPGAPTRRLGLALAVIATAQLMVVLDSTKRLLTIQTGWSQGSASLRTPDMRRPLRNGATEGPPSIPLRLTRLPRLSAARL
jgi:hypothetical protein